MRLAFGLTQLEAGGAQTRVLATAELLRQQGHIVDVFFLYRKREAFAGFPKVVLSSSGGIIGLSLAAVRLGVKLRKGRYDVFISNGVVVSVLGSVAALAAGVRNRVSVQTLAPQNRADLYNRFDKVWGTIGLFRINIANSNWTYRQYESYPTAYRKRLRVVTNGIAALPSAGTREAAREIVGIPEGEFRFVTLGRLAVQKNQSVLLAALVSVPEATLAIIGDGELREHLTSLAKKLGIADRVHFLGELSRKDVATQLLASDAYVFPSLWESFGLATVEAASVGLPLIVSDLEVHREVLGAGGSHSSPVFVEHHDVRGWIEAMNELRLASAEQLAEAGQVGFTIAAEHSLQKHAERLMAVIGD